MNSSTTPVLNNPASGSSSMNPGTHSWGQWWRSVRWPVMLLGFLATLTCGLVYYYSSLVMGSEINSHNWEVRQFSYRRDPFTHKQLSGITYRASLIGSGCWKSQNDLISVPDPAIKGHLTAPLLQPVRWDLVRLNDRYDTIGRGTILIRLVNSYGVGSNHFWIDWTNNEPIKAAALWPAAQQLVSLNLYAKLPDLFDQAAVEKNDAKFQQAVGSIMQAALLEYSQLLAQAGDKELAREVGKLGLSYGDHSELQTMVEQ